MPDGDDPEAEAEEPAAAAGAVGARSGLSRKHQKTIEALRARPPRTNIRFDDAAAALIALGCTQFNRGGSKVAFVRGEAEELYFDRPHKAELKKHHVALIRDFLVLLGY